MSTPHSLSRLEQQVPLSPMASTVPTDWGAAIHVDHIRMSGLSRQRMHSVAYSLKISVVPWPTPAKHVQAEFRIAAAPARTSGVIRRIAEFVTRYAAPGRSAAEVSARTRKMTPTTAVAAERSVRAAKRVKAVHVSVPLART